ncbi:MAG: polyprenyl synthetase family protein [Gemmatimonadetes bacterium]|nr:polyprenyl synthetase family protein [Gemmatimonadota bacterium]
MVFWRRLTLVADTMHALSTERTAIDAALLRLCDETAGSFTPAVAEAVRYSLLGEGKRLRGCLLLHAYRACGGGADATALAAAVEVVHAYSLVHDDLPCMDDDDVRRGRPTVHKVYSVAIATAAGLAMVPLAAQAAFRAARGLTLSDAEAGAIVRTLMRASGGGGMIGGQLLDLEAEGRTLGLEELERIHQGKTGALIEVSVRLGAMAARAPADQVEALGRYGARLGLAFQIADDVLDVTATTDELGKTAGRDVALRKSTYPALLGIAGARERADALIEEALSALHRAAVNSEVLEALARYAVERRS